MGLNWQASELADALEARGVEILASAGAPINGVQTDSRQIGEADCYIARIGASSDGHDYLQGAYRAGARSFVITDRARGEQFLASLGNNPPVTVAVVDEATEALGEMAKYHLEKLRQNGQITVIGLTGSAGKTTTKDLLASLLSTLGPTLAPLGSFNNEVGLPLTVLKATETTRYLVLEMGASGPGHLRYLTRIAPVDLAIELMVGSAHLGEFGGEAALRAAKAELLEAAPIAVLNLDDKNVAQMPAPGEKFFFSASGNTDAQYRASGLKADELDRYSFSLHTPSGSARVQLGLSGRHNVSNALAASAAAHLLGVETQAIAAVLGDRGPASAHRLNIFNYGGALIIDDAYNSSPESMSAALGIAQRIASGRKGKLIAVLGEMLELGEASDAIHESVGHAVTNAEVSVLLGVGKAAGAIETGLRASGYQGSWQLHKSANDAQLALEPIIAAGDTVLLKGSNGSGVWRIAEALTAQEGQE